MQITLNIPEEFVAEAQARGLSPETFVLTLVDHAMRSAESGASLPQSDLDTFFREMALHSEATPQLPDEAFTREAIYQDHDRWL